MRDITGIRRYEFWFAATLTVVYVVRRLIQEADRLNGMIELLERSRIPSSIYWRDLANYNHIINNNFPLIVGAVHLWAAWYVIHYLTVPNWSNRDKDEKSWLYAALSVLLVISSVAFYYFAKLHVHYRVNDAGEIIGLKIYSLYSKRNVLADAIGLGFVLAGYELMSQLGYYLNRKLKWDFPLFRYIYWFLIAAILVNLALTAHLPEKLWGFSLGGTLNMLATLIQIYWLQEFLHKSVLPYVRDSRASDFMSRILAYLVLWLAFNLVIWGAATHFTYSIQGLNRTLFWLTLFVPGLLALMRRVLTREKIELQTQVSQTSAELAGLQSQINPHFLFNALNSLYATALQENSEKTADGIQKLGDMMRFMLQENNRDRIPLEKEIEYLRNYIQLQRMRLDESHGIEIRVTIQEPERDVSIAPMILIPFVENAFKHGISLRKPSWIFITLTWDLTTLYFKVHNSRHPATASDPEKDRTGIGLENVRKRLELIYPTRHTLAIQASEQDYFIALTIRY